MLVHKPKCHNYIIARFFLQFIKFFYIPTHQFCLFTNLTRPLTEQSSWIVIAISVRSRITESIPGLPLLQLSQYAKHEREYTASDLKLEPGKAWERG